MQTHPWLEKYGIKEKSKYLIIGTHPPMPYCAKVDFFYGNTARFWRIISKIYRNDAFFDENKCINIDRIEEWMDKYRISITDMVYSTKEEEFNSDKDMGDISTIGLNPFLREWLDNSQVDSIIFTSKTESGNSPFGLFKKWFKNEFNKRLKKDENDFFILPSDNRKIKINCIYSP